jgi:membrane protease YdiL (CAAX protease family)
MSAIDAVAHRASASQEVAREIGLFLAIVALLTAACMSVALSQDVDIGDLEGSSALGQAALYSQAFMPAVAALAARRILTGGFAGLGLRRGAARRYLAVSYAVPVATVAVAYAAVWAGGAGSLDAGEAALAPLALTLGMIPFGALALGEEIGWRGLMAARLLEVTSLPRTALLTGLAWTAFHLPLMLLVPGAVEGVPMGYAVAMFGIGTIALSYPLAWLQLRSGSVWPATVMHAAMNVALYLVADPLTSDADPWLAGESGALLAISTVAAAAIWFRMAGRRRTKKEENDVSH